MNNFLKMLNDESGQSLVEYAFILSCVAILTIGVFKFLGHKLDNTLDNAANHLSN